MIFQSKKLWLTSVFFILSILVAACGGNYTDSRSTPSLAGDAPRSAPLDTVLVLSGPRSNYELVKSGDDVIVVDRVGNDGTRSTSGKTSIKFTDVSINLLAEKKSKEIPAKDVNTLVELYVAFFNRVPDADGLVYWIDQMKAGMSIDQLANNFYLAAIQYSDVTHYSADMTNADFVRIIYKNVLGRTGDTAPPDDDVNYWASELNSGRTSKGRLVVVMLEAARTFTGDAKWGWVPQLLENKISVGKYFAIEQGLNYNSAVESIRQGGSIVAEISSTDVSKAMAKIPAPDKNFSLSKSLVSILLTPSDATMESGSTQAYQLVATFSDGNKQLLSTPNVTSSNPSVATVGAAGGVKAESPGVVTITATYGMKVASANLVVRAAKLTSIDVSPVSTTVVAGANQSLSAIGVYSSGTRLELGSAARWTSSNNNVVTVNASGRMTGVAPGTAKVTVSSDTLTASVDVTVVASVPVSISIVPRDGSATTAPFHKNLIILDGTITYSNGATKNIFFANAVWTSSNLAVATSSGSWITPVGVGTTTITANAEGITGSLVLKFTDPAPVESQIRGLNANSKISKRSKVQLTPQIVYSNRDTITATNSVWSSSDTKVFTVDANGLLTGVSAGTATVQLVANGYTSKLSITLLEPLSAPSIVVKCDPAQPMSLDSASWNAAYDKDPRNASEWAVVDPKTCAGIPYVKVVADGRALLFEAKMNGDGSFEPAKTYLYNYWKKFTSGIPIDIGRSETDTFFYTRIYSITSK